MSTRWTDENRLAMLEMKRSGLTLLEIAATHNISRDRVRQVLADAERIERGLMHGPPYYPPSPPAPESVTCAKCGAAYVGIAADRSQWTCRNPNRQGMCPIRAPINPFDHIREVIRLASCIAEVNA